MHFNEILEKYPSQKDKIERLKKAEHIANVMLALKEHDGVKMLLEHVQENITVIDEKLLNQEKMSEQERACLFHEKKCWLWLIHQFDSQNDILKKIEIYKQKYD